MKINFYNSDQTLSITKVIIAINIAIFIIMYILPFEYFFIANFATMGYIFDFRYRPPMPTHTIFSFTEIHRLLTSNYLHGSFMHIIFNMLALYNLGSILESMIGKFKFFLIYTLSGIGGSILSAAMMIYLRPDSVNFSVGASGAVFGTAGCLVAIAYYLKDKGAHFIHRIDYKPLIIMLGLNLLIGMAASNIDNWAHVGGLTVGLIVGFIYVLQIDRNG